MAQNFLSPIDFRFSLKRSPQINYYVQSVSIPSLTAGFAPMSTPFHNLHISPDKLEYGDFTLTFRVDEEMASYLELYNWLLGITFPDNFDQYGALTTRDQGDNSGVYSDATLAILNSSKNVNIEVQFEDLFPVSLSEILMDVKSADINYVEATASFKYKSFTITAI
jgi:hypothetical protein